MSMNSIQKEHKPWALANFSDYKNIDHPLAGMAEESGEIHHAVLKQAQGIRTNIDYEDAFMDGIGDCGIYMVHLCELLGLDFARIVAPIAPISDKSRFHRLRMLHNAIASVNYAHDFGGGIEHALTVVGTRLKQLCGREYDFDGIMWETWQQVKERNWKDNPKDGVAS